MATSSNKTAALQIPITRFCVRNSVKETLFKAIDSASSRLEAGNKGRTYICENSNSKIKPREISSEESDDDIDEAIITESLSVSAGIARKFASAEQSGTIIDLIDDDDEDDDDDTAPPVETPAAKHDASKIDDSNKSMKEKKSQTISIEVARGKPLGLRLIGKAGIGYNITSINPSSLLIGKLAPGDIITSCNSKSVKHVKSAALASIFQPYGVGLNNIGMVDITFIKNGLSASQASNNSVKVTDAPQTVLVPTPAPTTANANTNTATNSQRNSQGSTNKRSLLSFPPTVIEDTAPPMQKRAKRTDDKSQENRAKETPTPSTPEKKNIDETSTGGRIVSPPTNNATTIDAMTSVSPQSQTSTPTNITCAFIKGQSSSKDRGLKNTDEIENFLTRAGLQNHIEKFKRKGYTSFDQLIQNRGNLRFMERLVNDVDFDPCQTIRFHIMIMERS